MNRVTHFEIYTENPEAVQPFYRDVFGWKFQKFEGGPIENWLVTTGDDNEPGINGGITCPREGRSEEHTSELQSQSNLVCRLLLEKKKRYNRHQNPHLLMCFHHILCCLALD